MTQEWLNEVADNLKYLMAEMSLLFWITVLLVVIATCLLLLFVLRLQRQDRSHLLFKRELRAEINDFYLPKKKKV